MNNSLSHLQIQKQTQKMSQRQIQAVNFLSMTSRDLREEIYKFANENPALEIVKDRTVSQEAITRSENFEKMLEGQESYSETLQQHLMEQIKLMKLSEDEFQICQALIYNLDKNGFYGSMLAPETLLDKSRPQQNPLLLADCIKIVQRLDPIGTCCKSAEESLFVQAQIYGDADEVTLFLLDGHLEFLNPPQPDKVYQKLVDFQKKWHSQKFATELSLDKINFDEDTVAASIEYILELNPLPAGNYVSDTSGYEQNRPDVVLTVEKKSGQLSGDNFSKGQICGKNNCYFQVKYASGELPEVRLAEDYSYDKEAVEKAKEFIANLNYRESTLVLQCCAIVKFQLDFFEKGPEFLAVLSRRQVAQLLGIHESTVSRMSAKKNSRYIQTEWGLFPASYFYPSGVGSESSKGKVSSTVIKAEIQKLLLEASKNSTHISDAKLTEILNQQGIKIARRTVAKYREQCGIKNSYSRKQ